MVHVKEDEICKIFGQSTGKRPRGGLGISDNVL